MSNALGCPYCEAEFTTAVGFATHIADAHSDAPRQPVNQSGGQRSSAKRSQLSRRRVLAATGVGLLGGFTFTPVGDSRYTPVASAQPTNDLVGEYLFDGNFEDTSQMSPSITGEPVGDPEFADGIQDQAVNLDGFSEYIRVNTTDEELTPTGGEWTISAWIFPEGTSFPGDQIVRRDRSAGGGFLYNFRINSTQTLRLEFDTNTDSNEFTVNTISTDATVPIDQWSHVAAVIDPNQPKIYIDGEEVQRGDGTNEDFDSIRGGELSIGAFGLGSSEFFTGRIDEVRLYDRALSSDEIDTLVELTDLRVNDFADAFPDGVAPENYGEVEIPIEVTNDTESEGLETTLTITGDDNGEIFNESISNRELKNEVDYVTFSVSQIDDANQYTATVTADAANAEQAERKVSFTLNPLGVGDFEVVAITEATPTEVSLDESFSVQYTVENVGDETARQEVSLELAGESVATKPDTLTSGQSITNSFSDVTLPASVSAGDTVGLTVRTNNDAETIQLSVNEETTESPVTPYTNDNGVVDNSGVVEAVTDWQAGELSNSEIVQVISSWQTGQPAS